MALRGTAWVRLNRLRIGVGDSAPAWKNEVWPLLRPVSVAQNNKPSASTMLSSNVQSIDLPVDCTAWRFWMMRQSNGCSTPARRSSAATKLILATGSSDEEEATAGDRQGGSIAICFTGKLQYFRAWRLKQRETGFPREWIVIDLFSPFLWLTTSDNYLSFQNFFQTTMK